MAQPRRELDYSHRNCTYILPRHISTRKGFPKHYYEATHGCWCSSWRLTPEGMLIWRDKRWSKPKSGELRRKVTELDGLRMLWADFNARDGDGLVSLHTKGSKESLAKTPVKLGDLVWLGDGDLMVVAEVVLRGGKLFGRPLWETQEDMTPEQRLAFLGPNTIL